MNCNFFDTIVELDEYEPITTLNYKQYTLEILLPVKILVIDIDMPSLGSQVVPIWSKSQNLKGFMFLV